jgi:hypothetical protein
MHRNTKYIYAIGVTYDNRRYKIMSLAHYVKELDSAYQSARKRYDETYSEYQAIENKMQDLNKKKLEYSPEGFEKRIQELYSSLSDIKLRLAAIPSEFAGEAAEIRAAVQRAFNGKYGMSPDRIDSNAIALLNSGALTDSEIAGLADKYANNATMLRLIGAQLQKSESDEAKTLGNRLVQATKRTPHLDIIDNLIAVAKKGLRTVTRGDGSGEIDPAEARTLSDGIATQLYPGVYGKSLAAAEAITED